MLTLVQKQHIFSYLLGKLLTEFSGLDIQIREAWRSAETCALYAKEGKGISHSCHELGLAIDINVWVNEGLYPSNNKADYEPMGAYWKSLSTAHYTCAWGGDFASNDCVHFSIEHNGIR